MDYDDIALKRIKQLQAENDRLEKRDGNATIVLCFDDGDNPFAREELKTVDVGVADNIYVVESQTVTQLQAEVEKHRWISVSERLPKDEFSILAYGYDGYGYKIVANTSYNLEFKKFRILSKVTHWKRIILP